MLYIVLDDDETWSSAAYVIPEEFLTDEQKALVSESDSKVFKSDIPRISVHTLVRIIEDAGRWSLAIASMKTPLEARMNAEADES